MTSRLTLDEQAGVRYWAEEVKVPIFNCNSKEKGIHLIYWSKLDFSTYNYLQRLEKGEYDLGCFFRTGKTFEQEVEKYLNVLDFDGYDSVKAWFGGGNEEEVWQRVQTAASRTRIEWHSDDKWRLHEFIFTNEPLINRRIHIGNDYLEIRAVNQAVIVYPSFHKNGNRYEPICNPEIGQFQNALALKAKISELSENYMSDKVKEKYDEWLEKSDTIIGEGEGRHDATKFKICSYYFKYKEEWLFLTDDDRFERAWQWHVKHCKPPRTRQDSDDIVRWVKEKKRVDRDKLHEEHRELRKRKQIPNDFNKTYRFSTYRKEIQEALKENVWVETCERSKWLVGDTKRNVIYKAHQEDMVIHDGKSELEQTVYYLSIDDFLIQCLPVNVTRHENPIDFGYEQINFTIEFKDSNGKSFTLVKKTISQIIEALISRGYVVPSSSETNKALLVILRAIEEDGRMQIEKSVDFEGYYYHDGLIHRSGKDIEKKHPERSKVECQKACDFLNRLSDFYIYRYKNGNVKLDRRDVLATSIKWTIAAPFNFAIKQLKKEYMNAIGFTGERSGGKSAMSDIILEIHGNKNSKSTEQSIYDLSAGSANTDSKLGNAVSKTTYPVVFSEYGTIEKYGRDEKIVETFKNIIDRIICRHGRKDSIFDYPFASLSPLVLNGNSLISKKPEVVKRFHWSKYSQADRHEKNDPRTVEYNQFMELRRHELKILGDWTINYVWNYQQELLLSKKYDAYQLMVILIDKFYEFAEVE